MNRLYGIIVGDVPEQSLGYYAKRCERLRLKQAGAELRRLLIGRVPSASLGLLGCVLGRHVMDTMFGPEIGELDPVNTYDDLTRPPESDPLDPSLSGRAIETPRSVLLKALPMLDADIRDRLVSRDWLELSAAICLQLLREVAR